MSFNSSELEDPHVNFNWGGYGIGDLNDVRRLLETTIQEVPDLSDDLLSQVYDLFNFFESFIYDLSRFSRGEVSAEYMEFSYEDDFVIERIEFSIHVLRECGWRFD